MPLAHVYENQVPLLEVPAARLAMTWRDFERMK